MGGGGWQLIGLTATPFHGDSRISLVDAGVFDAVVHETPIAPLIRAGYLSPVTCRIGRFTIAEGKLTRKPDGGDFTEGSQEAALEGAVDVVADDLVERGDAEGRRKWVVFCPGVKSSGWLRDALAARGVECRVVVGETPAKERDAVLADFRRPGTQLVALIGCNVFAEGFDVAGVDLVALVRATSSPTLYVQAVGRGMRVAPDKADCRVIDYGENVQRHGLIDDLKLNKPKDREGEAPVKEC